MDRNHITLCSISSETDHWRKLAEDLRRMVLKKCTTEMIDNWFKHESERILNIFKNETSNS